jgi:hypothetical protein
LRAVTHSSSHAGRFTATDDQASADAGRAFFHADQAELSGALCRGDLARVHSDAIIANQQLQVRMVVGDDRLDALEVLAVASPPNRLFLV